VKKATGALFERIPELVQEAIERDCSAQGVEPRGIKATSVPFLYHLYGFGFTRFLERGAYDKTYKKGDQRDMNHFTDGAACGYLVAEDGLFRETCSRVPQPHVEVISMRDLASKLR
jgi:hypothetical protein